VRPVVFAGAGFDTLQIESRRVPLHVTVFIFCGNWKLEEVENGLYAGPGVYRSYEI
jgi:hypothetical protein